MIPEDVWLTNLTATVSPAVQISSDSGSSSSSDSGADLSSVQGPSLRIEGCGTGHEAVARFLAALRDIGGVTRVSVLSSDRPDPDQSAAGGASEDCATRDFISKFEIVAAFDAVQVGTSTEVTGTPPAPSEPTASGFDGLRGRPEPGRRRATATGRAEAVDRAADREGPRGRRHVHSGNGDCAMRRNELNIVLTLAVIGMIAAFWLLVISPRARPGREPEAGHRRASGFAGGGASRPPPPASRRATISGPTTAAWWCSARRCRRTATRQACWSSFSGSPTALGVEFQSIGLSVQRAEHRCAGADAQLLGVSDAAGHALGRVRRRHRHPGRFLLNCARHRSGRRDAADRRLGGTGWSARDALRPQVHRRLLPDRDLPGEPRRNGSDAARRGRRHRPPADRGRVCARPREERGGSKPQPDPDAYRHSRRHHLPHPR